MKSLLYCLFQSLGNHEFDNGVSGLTPFIENLTCPVLAANLILNKVPELASEINLKKSIVIDIDGVEIGIIGYLTPETKVLAVQNNVEYIDEVIALKEEVKNLQNKGIKIIIALGHSGFTKDLQIAKEVDGVDLVIGGHTNTFLWNGTAPDSEEPQGPYPTYITQASGRKVAVVQAYAYTKYLGKLHIIFNSNGEIISADGKPMLLDKTIIQDPDVLRIIERYRGDVLNVADETVGNTSAILDGVSCKIVECNLGNLITDAMIYRYAAKYKKGNWTDAPIAIIQAGGIRSSVAHVNLPAIITKGDLLTVMPFRGHLVTVTMNGSVLLQMLEHSVTNYNIIDLPGQFLQFSGIKVTYNLNKPAGYRVVRALARCGACSIPKYSEVNDEKYYTVIMPNFVSNGGDGYAMFKDLSKYDLDYDELQSTIYYVSHHSPVFPEIDGRITILYETVSKDSSFSIAPSLLILIIVTILSIIL